MSLSARYVHTNLIAEDWRRLSAFYQNVFGCTPVPPERDFTGADIDAATGLSGAHLTGIHLRLPGYEGKGPTLEVFHYDTLAPREPVAVNRPGYGHLAFAVDDVWAAREAVLTAGGKAKGDVVTLQTSDGAKVTWCYATDPEGNVVELQSWSK
jgi:predicted enzyme related to lactoylglutathione lyase